MALIACSECGQQVSMAAAMCPHCGAPIKPKRRLRWLWWAIPVVALVLAAGGVGWFLVAKGQHDALVAAQDSAWAKAVTTVESMGSPSEVGADGSYLLIKSGGQSQCTAAEIEQQYQDGIKIVAEALGYQPSDELLLINGITRATVAVTCNQLKSDEFTKNVSAILSKAKLIFATNLGLSDAATAELQSMRGLDGTQERREDSTSAGPLVLTFQYDAANGVQIRIERATD